jgi:hypothetical protein
MAQTKNNIAKLKEKLANAETALNATVKDYASSAPQKRKT